MTVEEPPRSVLRAFGAEGAPRRAVGGQGTSWIAGDVVLKPGGGDVHTWLAEAMDEVTLPAPLGLARAVRSRDGGWTYEGWTATGWVSGSEPDYSRVSTWIGILEAGRAFHRAVAHLTQPACLDARADPWALADRCAWGELTLPIPRRLSDVVGRLRAALAPLGSSQVVHGDLTQNVLFHAGRPAAVIDVSPYWRPTEYAEGVVVADALCWHDARPSLLQRVGVSVPAVARALLFRLMTSSEPGGPARDERYRRATEAIGL